MEVLRDLTRLRDHYYSVYLSKLEAKIEKQRKEISAREQTIKKKLEKEETRRAKNAHKFTYRLPKSNPKHNTEYLQQVPKSRYYHLVMVEELMRSRGLLKHTFEVEEFWKKARSDHSFWVKPIPATISPDRLTEHMVSRYSSLTTKSRSDESIVNSTKDTHNAAPPAGGILKKMEETSDEEDHTGRADTPPLVFPEQPKFPKLHSFNSNLTPLKLSKSIKSNIAQNPGADKTERMDQHRRKLNQHMKRNAYNVAVVNTAMSRRLMDRHGIQPIELAPLSAITEIWCGGSDTSSVTSSKCKAAGRKKGLKKRVVKDAGTVVTAVTSQTEAKLSSIKEVPSLESETAPLPLSMDMMLSSDEHLSLKDAKCPSAVWVNYTM